jgi:hypothetical protein
MLLRRLMTIPKAYRLASVGVNLVCFFRVALGHFYCCFSTIP